MKQRTNLRPGDGCWNCSRAYEVLTGYYSCNLDRNAPPAPPERYDADAWRVWTLWVRTHYVIGYWKCDHWRKSKRRGVDEPVKMGE